jgi:hypothetical protein
MSPVKRRGTLLLLVVFPDSSRSLIPVSWTDWRTTGAVDNPSAAGSGHREPCLTALTDLLHMRAIADALLGRCLIPQLKPADHIAFGSSHGLRPCDRPISWLNSTPHAIAVYAYLRGDVTGAHATVTTGRPAMALPEPVFHRLDRASFAWRLREVGLATTSVICCVKRRRQSPAPPGCRCGAYSCRQCRAARQRHGDLLWRAPPLCRGLSRGEEAPIRFRCRIHGTFLTMILCARVIVTSQHCGVYGVGGFDQGRKRSLWQSHCCGFQGQNARHRTGALQPAALVEIIDSFRCKERSLETKSPVTVAASRKNDQPHRRSLRQVIVGGLQDR